MKLHTVSLDITTACDQACPDCCCGIHMHRPAVHHDWPYFEKAARILHGIDRLIITGGEPTLHPAFGEFSDMFRSLFGCRLMTLNSNGFGFARYAQVIKNDYDWVDFSHYGLIERDYSSRMLEAKGCIVHRIEATKVGYFVPRILRAEGKPCHRACFRSGGFAYADGQLWGCCVAPGIPGAEGIGPTPFWKDLLSATLPCKDCWFAE